MSLFITAIYLKDQLPTPINILQALETDPIQRKIEQENFTIQFNKYNYQIYPRFDYNLKGLVVSVQAHSGDKGTHKSWQDYINSADICVVWGNNAKLPTLPQFKFSSGEFTCYVTPPNNKEISEGFNYQISNNHLISENRYIRKKIKALNIGDQIEISGWLADYGKLGKEVERQSSTTRFDTGNGACEIIYVYSIKILKKSVQIWKYLILLSIVGILISLFSYIYTPYKNN